MTIPSFLSSTFFFNQDANVTNVSQIISDLTTILTGQSPAWTNPSAGVFVSPVDSAGRFMTISLTASSTTLLVFNVTDQNGILIANRSISIDGSPADTVNYYSGQYHLYIETLRAPTPEWAGAFLLDPDPYALNSLQTYVMGNAFRSASGTNDGQGSVFDQFWMLENGTPTNRERSRAFYNNPTGSIGLTDFQGNIQLWPLDISINPSGKQVWGGPAYQCYITDSSVPASTIKQVAIDDSTLAFFRSTVAGSVGSARLMIRVG